MKILRQYSNIKGFLERFTILKIGNFHIRIHKIINKDQTNFYHNHPFNYISIILKGGYQESYFTSDLLIKNKKHSFLSIIIRSNKYYHRINEIKGETLTLFISYGKYKWGILNLNNKIIYIDGLYERNVNNIKVWAKREKDIWFIGNKNKEIAKRETRHSINQFIGNEIK